MRRLLASLILLVSVSASNPTVLCSQQSPGRAPRLSNEGGGSGIAAAATWAHQSLEGMGLTAELPSDAEQLDLGAIPEVRRYLGDRVSGFGGEGWSMFVARVTFDSKATTKVLREFGSGMATGLGEDPDITDFKWSLQPAGSDRIRIIGSFRQQSVGLSLDGYVLSLGRDVVCAAVFYQTTEAQSGATALRVLKSISPER
jgi:hypothetical protein